MKRKNKYFKNEGFIKNLLRYIGQTITVITSSGGVAGSGFTGVLLSVSKDHIRLITEFSSKPELNINKLSKDKGLNNNNFKNGIKAKSLGSITEIPMNKIVAFIHTAI
jgi:hypothetical protein